MELVHISKDKLGDFSRDITRFAFQIVRISEEDHFHAVTNLGGMLLLILKDDQDNVKVVKIILHLELCSKFNVTLYEAGIGTCWKSPQYIFDLKYEKLWV